MKFPLSNIAIWIVVLSCILIDFNLKNWKQQDRVIEWDVHSYYAYLPALFIYKDIKLSKSDYHFGENYWLFWAQKNKEGQRIIKTNMGMAILYAPFFGIAHALALLTDYPENGFSEPYKVFLLLSAIFYLFVGLDFLKKILYHYKFTDKNVSITILLTGLGTNLLAYSSQSAPMPHVYNFCLFAIFIYYSIRWHEAQTIKNTLIIAFTIGLITLIRPTNILIVIFFILYDVGNWTDLKQRVVLFRRKLPLLLLMIVPFFLVWLPQFIYWKTVSGQYIYYGYPDERFFFNKPKIIDGLFSFRKGWLLYTPMMGFAIMGIFLMRDNLKKLRLPVLLFLIINIYVAFSWWAWWYGGTYGQRGMIESYALLALPFASLIKFVNEKKWYWSTAFYFVALFFIWLNIFQTYQFEYHSLHWDGMTKELYIRQFGKLNKIDNFDKWVSSPDYEAAMNGVDRQVNAVVANSSDENNARKEDAGKRFHLRALSGKYVCADKTLNNAVLANSDNPWEWETFSLITLPKENQYAIRAYNKRFFCAEMNKKGEVNATRENIGYWETFIMIKLDSNLVAFKAANGKYLSADKKTLQLIAESDSIGKQEKFMLIE